MITIMLKTIMTTKRTIVSTMKKDDKTILLLMITNNNNTGQEGEQDETPRKSKQKQRKSKKKNNNKIASYTIMVSSASSSLPRTSISRECEFCVSFARCLIRSRVLALLLWGGKGGFSLNWSGRCQYGVFFQALCALTVCFSYVWGIWEIRIIYTI